MKLLSILLLVSSVSFVNAQDSFQRAAYHAVVQEYQIDLLDRKDSLVHLLKKCVAPALQEDLSALEKSHIQSIVYSLSQSLRRDTEIEKIKKLSLEKAKKNVLVTRFGKLEAELIAINNFLMDMSVKKLIRKTDLSVAPDSSSFYDVLQFLDIKKGESILDVGTGYGLLPLLLGMAHDSVRIGLNDRKRNLVKYLQHEITNNHLLKESNEYTVYKGSASTLGISKARFDKVVMVNTLHHLSNKKRILTAVRQTIGNGMLYLIEHVKSTSSCKRAMSLSDIQTLLSSIGFEVVRMKTVRGLMFFQCESVQTK